MDTSKWTNELHKITAQFQESFGSLSAEALNQKPRPKQWSIAQNIDHLIRVNESYYPILEQVRADTLKAPWPGRIGFLHRFFGKFILKGSGPVMKKKISTFPIWEPAESDLPADMVDRFAKHQEELARWMASCSDILDQRTLISSPANRNIVYQLDTAFDIIVAHERRHLEQARKVLALQITGG